LFTVIEGGTQRLKDLSYRRRSSYRFREYLGKVGVGLVRRRVAEEIGKR
jgi:hypothetical protein